MKIKSGLQQLAILFGLLAFMFVGYGLGFLTNVTTSPGSKYDRFGFPTLPPLTKLEVPSQTVDRVTATIEGAYADPSRIVFIIRFSSQPGNFQFNSTYLVDEHGEQIGMTVSMLGPLPDEPSVYLIEFSPDVWLDEPQLNGQLFTAFTLANDDTHIIKYDFKFSLPIHPFLTFNPKKAISIEGVNILLDRLIIAPATTYAYLCYPNRSDENWILTGENIFLNINRQASNPNRPSPWLFDSTIVEGEQFGEPGWTPPNEESRCIKLGFPIGDAHPFFLTLTLPGLENAMTTVVPDDELSAAYEKLLPQGIDMKWSAVPERGIVIEYKKLPEGMTEKEAYRKFLEALGYVCKGPWVFRIFLFH